MGRREGLGTPSTALHKRIHNQSLQLHIRIQTQSLKVLVCGVRSYDSYLKKDHPAGKTLHGTGKSTIP